MIPSHRKLIENAASQLIAVADESGVSLINIIIEMERFIVQGTKVGDAVAVPVSEGRRGYTLIDGRLAELA